MRETIDGTTGFSGIKAIEILYIDFVEIGIERVSSYYIITENGGQIGLLWS